MRKYGCNLGLIAGTEQFVLLLIIVHEELFHRKSTEKHPHANELNRSLI